MTRRADWRSRLIAYIEASRNRPFAWGDFDCSTFAAGAVEAMTGIDHAAELRGYSTLAGGLKRLQQAGYIDHVDMATALLDRQPRSQARFGDIAVIDAEEGAALGVVDGTGGVLAATMPSGLRRIDLLDRRVRGHVFRV